MANGKFIVCTFGIPGAGQEHGNCADCISSIVIDAPVDKAAIYICEACLPKRLASNEPDEVEVTVGGEPEKDKPLDGEALFEAIAHCREARDGACDCGWCKHLNPIAADIAAAIKKHPEANKLTRVYVLIRMLGEAAVAANSMLGLHHRDASFTAGVVARELHRVADREHEAAVATMKPIIEEALREAGVDVEQILRSKLPEQTH